jgi:DNA polymerase III subunit beta
VKITAQASAIASALATVATGRSKRPVARIVAADGAITVACADSNIAITATAAATVTEPGAVAVAYYRMSALVSGFAGGATVTIDMTNGNMVAVACANSRSRLQTIPIDDLPDILTMGDAIAQIEIGAVDLLRLLEPLAAAAGDMTRFYLTGVFIHSVDDRIVGIATDGARLLRVGAAAGSQFSATRDLIVPRESALALRRLLARIKGAVTLRRSRTLIAVTGPGFEFVSRLVSGPFPNYENVIPPASANICACNRHELLASISRLTAVASVEPPLIALSWSDTSGLALSLAREPETGADSIAAECSGAAKVAIPIAQLAAMLGEFDADRLQLEAAELRPLVIRDDKDKLGLISRAHWSFGTEAETAAPAR